MKLPLPLAAALLLAAPLSAEPLSRDIFKELIEINTTDSAGNTTLAAVAMANRLREAGLTEVQVLEPVSKKGNLVARLKGSGAKRPILWICHLDVVEAKREDWTTDPFIFLEKDGYFYGRGTEDIKGACALLVHTLIRLQKEGYKGQRDIILALTAGEEDGKANGVDWLLKNKRELVDAEFVLNPDAGSFQLNGGTRVLVGVQASEKLYADFALEVKGKGGHSARPGSENTIYRLAEGLGRLARHRFPFELNEVTRAYFERQAAIVGGADGADMKAVALEPADEAAVVRLSSNPFYNSRFRTTCVATRLEGGHANNALPGSAKAVVNCRILPGHSQDEIKAELARVLDDPQISVTALDDYGAASSVKNPLSALKPEVLGVLDSVVQNIWPGLPIVPFMDAGASDSAITRAAGLPTYGIPGIFTEINDNRAHGKDERLSVKEFYWGSEFFYRFNLALTR